MLTTSPTAQTPSAAVRWYSSTTTNPRSSRVTPVPSASRPVGERSPTDRQHHGVDGDVLAVAEADGGPRPVGRVPVHLHPGVDVDPPLAKRARHDADHVAVASRQQRRQRLEHRDLAAEVREHRGELAADGAAADHGHRRRQSVERQDLVGGEHQPAVDVEAGDGARHRPGGEHDVAARDLDIGAVRASSAPATGSTRTRRPGSSVPTPSKVTMPRPFMSPARPLKSWSTTFCLRPWLTAKSTTGWPGLDAELLGPRHGAHHAGGLEELLGRDTPPVQAGPTHLLALDHGDLQAGRRPVQGGGVPAGPTADHDDIELAVASAVVITSRCLVETSESSLTGASGLTSSCVRRGLEPRDHAGRADVAMWPAVTQKTTGRSRGQKARGGKRQRGARPAKPSSGKCHHASSSSPSCQHSSTSRPLCSAVKSISPRSGSRRTIPSSSSSASASLTSNATGGSDVSGASAGVAVGPGVLREVGPGRRRRTGKHGVPVPPGRDGQVRGAPDHAQQEAEPREIRLGLVDRPVPHRPTPTTTTIAGPVPPGLRRRSCDRGSPRSRSRIRSGSTDVAASGCEGVRAATSAASSSSVSSMSAAAALTSTCAAELAPGITTTFGRRINHASAICDGVA